MKLLLLTTARRTTPLKLFSRGQFHEGRDKMEGKKECVEEVFYDVGGATDRAVEAIYHLLELPLPADKRIVRGSN